MAQVLIASLESNEWSFPCYPKAALIIVDVSSARAGAQTWALMIVILKVLIQVLDSADLNPPLFSEAIQSYVESHLRHPYTAAGGCIHWQCRPKDAPIAN